MLELAFFSAICVISSHSLEEKDIGFSTNMLIPCCITFLATTACVFVGVHTGEPSSRSFSTISSIAEYACAPCLLAISLALAEIKIAYRGQAVKLPQHSCMVLAPSTNTYNSNSSVTVGSAYHTEVNHSMYSLASADTILAYISRILLVNEPSFPLPTRVTIYTGHWDYFCCQCQ